jgi:hypothetical protein
MTTCQRGETGSTTENEAVCVCQFAGIRSESRGAVTDSVQFNHPGSCYNGIALQVVLEFCVHPSGCFLSPQSTCMNEESSDKERNMLASCFFYGKDLGVGDPHSV